MKNKRILVYAAVLAVLLALIYLQFRTWRNFDWGTFWGQFKSIHLVNILRAVGLIYFTYLLRAWRWEIFLRPARKNGTIGELLPPTVIGFTGLALLGRLGELIRPYLIARRTKLSFSSQMAVWAVERIFDIGAFTVLIVLAIFLSKDLRFPYDPAIYPRLRTGGFLLIGFVAALSAGSLIVARYGNFVADWVQSRFAHLAANLGQRIAQKVREFHSGLDTIHSFVSFVELSTVSLLMWWSIALSYREVTHSYGPALADMTVPKVLLLMGSSMLGSLIQLPGVGGGSQLATISALEHIFKTSHELAASCGILLWLVTFVSIVPLGLILAHRERLSLRRLSDESHLDEDAEIANPA
ncbi:MAG TPA: lysylphosphatidylglycerol synthase transmembrane domain-containing protein [Terriglobales bacterium]|jgi:hypothetical protein|nr:lysylphosphatidylglycerol synthase transmembrane domain-containing protein [Terriglobales bacterium]